MDIRMNSWHAEPMLWLVFAAQVASTESSKPQLRSLFTYEDVPVDLVPLNRLQTVALALIVGPDGKIRKCNVELSSGNAKLDSYTCGLVVRRAKFHPGPGYSVTRSHINWWVGDGRPPSSTYGDLDLTVAALPDGLHSPVEVRLEFNVDPAGKISNCRANDEHQSAVLVPTACDQLAKSFNPDPVKGDDGKLVSSTQDATVVFETK
jgi:hypothetical protein